jgi:hypothetical protein
MAKTIKITRKTVSGSKAGKVDPKPVPESKPEPKKAAPAPEPKKPAAKKERTGREVISGDLKITVLAKENPRRPGTMAHKTFSLYRTGMTVGEWREACRARDCDEGYLHYDIAKGRIAVK